MQAPTACMRRFRMTHGNHVKKSQAARRTARAPSASQRRARAAAPRTAARPALRCRRPRRRSGPARTAAAPAASSSIPERRMPTVSATQTAPIRLSSGVASASATSSTGRTARGQMQHLAPAAARRRAAAARSSASAPRSCMPSSSDSGCGERTSCSSEPSSRSLRNSVSSESSPASSSATKIVPAAMRSQQSPAPGRARTETARRR